MQYQGPHRSRQNPLSLAEDEVVEALNSGVGPDELELALLSAWDDYQTPPNERARVAMWINALRRVMIRSQGYRPTLRVNLRHDLAQRRRRNRWSTHPRILQSLIERLNEECYGTSRRFDPEYSRNMFSDQTDWSDFRDAYAQARQYQQQYERYRRENPSARYRVFNVGQGGCRACYQQEAASHNTYHARHPDEMPYSPRPPRSARPRPGPNPNHQSYHSRHPFEIGSNSHDGQQYNQPSSRGGHPQHQHNQSSRVPNADEDPWTEYREWQQHNENAQPGVSNNDTRSHYSYSVEEVD
ncbi:hypothetical protein B7463_g1764, partial [Scytalidium lignicola]